MADRFRRHPATRIIGHDGREALAGQAGPTVCPCALALDEVLTLGTGFRIGLPGVPQPREDFETLTSGSTGTPRRILRSVESWTASFAVNARLFGIGPGARLGIPGSLSQSLALYGALEGACLGAEVTFLAGLRPDRQAAAIASQGIEVLYATPAQLRALQGDMPDLRLILVGGAKLDAALRAQLARQAPAAELREFYGAAEASFITLADASTPPDSVGPPYPGVEVEVRDGEVWVKSPYLFKSYASDPGSAQWCGDWLSVGEMGRMEGGFLYLSGRKGRMVTVADHNVFPEEVEALMESLPGILRAAILPVPDAARGHVLHAVAMGDPACEAVVLAALRAELGPMKAPRSIRWRSDWPITASGKTDFAALRRAE